MKKILLADDEPQMIKIVAAYLKKEGFEVVTVVDGQEAVECFDHQPFDLAILDWMMPQMDGAQVCQYIKENSSTKVLMLTAKSQSEDEVAALTFGADDYVKKPFDPRVLVARVKKLLQVENAIVVGPLMIQANEQRAYLNGQMLNLTKIEYQLLLTFMQNKGVILSRDKLITWVWGFDYEGDYRTVDTHLRRLRGKIGEQHIKTHRGLGYSLEEVAHENQE